MDCERVMNGSSAKNVLVFPYGTEISNEIVNSLVHNKHFHLICATSDEALIQLSGQTRLHFLPHVNDPGFEFALLELIRELGVSLVIPAHDDVALLLSEMSLPKDCAVVGQSHEANLIVRYKSKTYASLKHIVPVPATYRLGDDIPFPVFIKPDRGQGSKSTHFIPDKFALDNFMCGRDSSAFIICEFLPGEEFTVDCFSDNGSICFAGPRTRERTINGISTLSRSFSSGPDWETLQHMAAQISAHFRMHGLWFFQAKKSANAELHLLEVATRVSGTMMVNRAKGINFVELALWQATGHEVSINASPGQVLVRRTLDPHYKFDQEFDRLLVDFDDTLLVNDKINVELIGLIFKAKNENKPVILITKNQNRRLATTLHKYGITAIFDDVIHLDVGQSKSSFARKGDLLVDDSFAERNSVLESGVKSISLDMVGMYLD
ncbi:MAG: ATP-grasp domain-containing protein [Pseudomonadota bacterium]